MYEQVFGLTNRPFTSTPFVPNYFPSDSIHHALSQIQLAISRGTGPVIATGASGTGKSLLLAMLGEHFKQEFTVVNLLCANMTQRTDLLKAILFELDLPYKDLGEADLRLSLVEYLKRMPNPSEGILMLVDEAHSVPADILDEFRLITNFARQGRAIVSLVLVGLPSLEDHLIESKSESLNQRIASRCYLMNLTKNETSEYIATHLERAGANGIDLFTTDAIDVIHQCSDGCPRVINQICDYALVLAASEGATRITSDIVNNAWNDVQSIPTPTSSFAAMESTQPAQTDDLMVLEFGKLDDASDDTIEFATMDSDDDPSQPANANSEYPNHDVVTPHFEQPELSETDTEESIDDQPSIIELHPTTDYPSLEVRTEVDQNAVHSEDLNNDDVPSFEDPFSETFREEEPVYNSCIPGVSEHNLTSLMLSSEQLELLDKLAQQVQTGDEASDFSGLFSKSLTNEKETAGEDVASESDLKMTEQGLLGLEQVEDDVRRLQRDLMFTQQQFSSSAVHPDYEYCNDDQPLEELLQSHTVIDEQLLAEISDEHPEDAATIQFEPEETEPASEILVDDRDMMVVEQPRRAHFDFEVKSSESHDEVARISTGKAERMNYKDLFHQLRTAGQ